MAATITHSLDEQSTAKPAPRDFRQDVTDSIVRMLEEGVAPWQKPWEPGAPALSAPMNPTTGRAYRGGNAIHLIATAMRKGYDDPRWMTYKQAAEEGWQVRRREKGTQIEFWDIQGWPGSSRARGMDQPEDQEQPGSNSNDHDRRRFIFRVYTVFNAKQIDGIPAYLPKQRSQFEVVQAGESILKNSGVTIAHDQNDRAFYSHVEDAIHLPPKEAFKDQAGYYGTALHELAHATGHPSRLNRSTLNESYRFGDLNYAKEELRAELASVFLAAERGIPHNPEQHAAYVGSWIKVLKQDKNEIFRAAHDASRATDFLLSLERDRSIADEALAAGPDLNSEAGAGSQALSTQQESTDLQRDREDLEESIADGAHGSANAKSPARQQAKPESMARESIETTARYEPGSATVNVHTKTNGTDRHVAADGPPGPGDPTSIAGNRLSSALKDAKFVVERELVDSLRFVTAQTQSGSYRGKIIGETNYYVFQQQSASTAVIHPKQLLDVQPHIGQAIRINYSNDHGAVRELHNRARAKDLGR